MGDKLYLIAGKTGYAWLNYSQLSNVGVWRGYDRVSWALSLKILAIPRP